MSVVVQKSLPSAIGVVKAVTLAVGGFFATLAAAGAVAQAVENRRQPDETDLAVLGLEGVRFKKYY